MKNLLSKGIPFDIRHDSEVGSPGLHVRNSTRAAWVM